MKVEFEVGKNYVMGKNGRVAECVKRSATHVWLKSSKMKGNVECFRISLEIGLGHDLVEYVKKSENYSSFSALLIA